MIRENPPKFFLVSALLVIFLLLVGCIITTPIPIVTPTFSPDKLTSLTVTLTSPSPTTIPTITPTSVPTLTYPQRAEYIENMFLTNGECQLPCWWGEAIVPGTTTLKEAVNYFASQGLSQYSREEDVLVWDFSVAPPRPVSVEERLVWDFSVPPAASSFYWVSMALLNR
jgi:hypothetical protein